MICHIATRSIIDRSMLFKLNKLLVAFVNAAAYEVIMAVASASKGKPCLHNELT